jgi:glycosyltransferase involved in cell wall biosynthesis
MDANNSYVVITNDENNIPLAVKKQQNVKIVSTKALPLSLYEQIAIPQIIKNEKIELFHAPSFVVPLYFPCTTVITLHDLIHVKYAREYSSFVKGYYALVVRHALRRAAKIVTDSESSSLDIQEWAKVDKNRIAVIPLAAEASYKMKCEHEEMRQAKCKFGVNEKYILYNGSRKSNKNVPSLIKAFIKLRNEKRMNHRLVISGERNDAVLKADLRLIREIRNGETLKGEIIYTGYVSDEELALLYSGADLFAFPSFYEGFGLPVLEAMACGCPVVTSRVSSLPEVCGDAARYVDPYDVNSIADGIYSVSNEESLRRNLIQKGLDRAKLFSWEKCARETLAVYEEAYRS